MIVDLLVDLPVHEELYCLYHQVNFEAESWYAASGLKVYQVC